MPGHFLLFDQELVRMTFIVGIAVSVMLYERTHRTTGSLVVPGYIGVQLLNPLALLVTAVNAGLTYVLVSRVLPRFAAVYGRTRFVMNIFVSVMIALMMGPVLSFLLPAGALRLESIGYVIPALIAYDMNRQGVRKTATTVSLAGCLAAIPALLIVAIAPGVVDPMLPAPTGLYDVGEFWLPIAALISTGAATTLHSGHRLRCGGFIGAMYLGLSAVNPAQLVFIAAVALTTYGIVQYLLKPIMIIFGRRKFSVMLMTGSLISWISLEVIDSVMPGGMDIDNLPIAALFVPALLANDMERSSVVEVLVGAMIAATVTLSTVVVLSGLVDYRPVPSWAPPMLMLSAGILFWPRIAPLLPRIKLPELPLGDLAELVRDRRVRIRLAVDRIAEGVFDGPETA